MGAEDIKDDELEAFGVEIVKQTDSGSRSLKISENGLPTYINLVKEKLTKGFWNEIVGPKEILFIFKFEDGHIEEFILSPEINKGVKWWKLEVVVENLNGEKDRGLLYNATGKVRLFKQLNSAIDFSFTTFSV